MTVPGSPASVLAAILRADAAHPYDASNPRQRRLATFSSYPSFPHLPSLTTDEVFLPQNAVLDANLAITGTLTSQGWGTAGIATVTASYTPSPADAVILASAAIAPLTITLPDATQPGFVAGQRYTIKKTDATANAVTITASAGQKIDGATTQTLTTGNTETSVVFDGANWWVWSGITTATVTPGGTASGDLSGTYPSPTVTATHLTAALPVNQGGTGLAAAGSAGQSLTTAFGGGLAWANAPVDWLNVVTGYGADPTGVADSATAINNALLAAAPGQVIYFPAGTYLVNAPVNIPPMRILRGDRAGTTTYDQSYYGSIIKVGASFTSALAVTAALTMLDVQAGGWPSLSPTATGSSIGIQMENLIIDGSAGPANVDGISAWGSILGVEIRSVSVSHASGHGVSHYTNPSSTGTPKSPDGWHVRRMLIQAAGLHGWYGLGSDSDLIDVHVQNCASGADGFYISSAVTSPQPVGGANSWLIGCRSDLNDNGYTFDVFQTGGWDGITLSACGTQGNRKNGVNVVNNSVGNNSARQTVIIDGCTFTGDGTNAGSGGGGFAGISVTGGQNVVRVSNTIATVNSQWSTGSPDYGLNVAAQGGHGPVSVRMASSLLQGMVAPVSSDGTAAELLVTASGITGSGTTSPGTRYGDAPVPIPADHGLQGWAYDPAVSSATLTLVSQTLYLAGVFVRQPITITKLWIVVATAGSAQTSTGIMLINSAGTVLCSSTSAAGFQSPGGQSFTVASTPLLPGMYWVALFNNGGTMPILRGQGGSGSTFGDVNLSGAGLRFAVNGTAVTAVPGSITPASNSVTGVLILWAGVS